MSDVGHYLVELVFVHLANTKETLLVDLSDSPAAQQGKKQVFSVDTVHFANFPTRSAKKNRDHNTQFRAKVANSTTAPVSIAKFLASGWFRAGLGYSLGFGLGCGLGFQRFLQTSLTDVIQEGAFGFKLLVLLAFLVGFSCLVTGFT